MSLVLFKTTSMELVVKLGPAPASNITNKQNTGQDLDVVCGRSDS